MFAWCTMNIGRLCPWQACRRRLVVGRLVVGGLVLGSLDFGSLVLGRLINGGLVLGGLSSAGVALPSAVVLQVGFIHHTPVSSYTCTECANTFLTMQTMSRVHIGQTDLYSSNFSAHVSQQHWQELLFP
jgi:hypothetical protein